MMTRLHRLGQRSTPQFGQLTLGLTLACAAVYAGYLLAHPPLVPHDPRRIRPVSILSFLPDAILLDRLAFYLCGAAFYLGAICWAALRLLPFSSWLAAFGFTALLCLRMEASDHVTHVYHLTNNLLLVHAFWYHCCAHDLRDALAQGRFWSTPLYPQWVHELGIFYVGCFYGLSGWTKVATSGLLGWPNGLSMQLWVNLWGRDDSPWKALILANRDFAAALQAGALLVECSAPLAIFFPQVRSLVGLGIVGFHYGQISLFGWGFHGNALLSAVLLFPVSRWLDRGSVATINAVPDPVASSTSVPPSRN
jgi:hypothetical protein